MASKTKSPLIDKPLRYLAQSCDEALDDLIFDKILTYYLVGCFLIAGLILEKNFRHFLLYFSLDGTLMAMGTSKARCGYLSREHSKKFLENQKAKMTDDDMRLASYHLSRHMRTSAI